MRQQVEQSDRIGNRRGFFEESLFHRAAANRGAIHPAAIVAHHQDDLVGGALGAKPDGPFPRLAGGLPVGGQLQPVVRRVANEMGERLGESIEHRPIQLDVPTLQDQPDLLSQLAREVPDQAGKAGEQLLDRRESRRDDGAVQAVDQEPDPGAHLLQLGPDVAIGDGGQPVAGYDELVDLIDQRVEPLQVHPDLPGRRAGGGPGRIGHRHVAGAGPPFRLEGRGRGGHRRRQRAPERSADGGNLPATDGLDAIGKPVHTLKQEIHQLAGGLQRALAHRGQDLLPGVGELGQGLEAEGGGRAFYRVKSPEELVDREHRARLAFPDQQGGVTALNVIATLGKE